MLRRPGDGSYVLVYNGELYNTADLRAELEAKGYAFKGYSDTEVLLLSYIEWGSDCVRRLNGIYAFAVWNESEQALFLARDRFGVKPLFYAQRDSSFLFASELKALLANPLIKPEITAEGLAEVFALGPSRSPGHGVFKNVYEVKPGNCLLFDRHGLRAWCYWQIESREHADDLDTTTAKVRGLLEDAIRRQLVADAPVCTLLSGGLDSSALTAFTARVFAEEGRGPLHTFSINHEGNENHFKPNQFEPAADNYWINLISEQYETVHHPVMVKTADLADALSDAMLARDLPGMADIDSSLILFCKEIKKLATVAQSGECADEIFGGYPWYYSEEALTGNTFPWLRSVEQRKQIYSKELLSLIRPDEYIARRYQETIDEVPRLPGEEPLEARRRELFYLNFMWFMQTLLERKDRMSMACGLEVRVPFCDHRLVEYVWNIPWQMKNCDGMEKGILRRSLAGVLPEEVLFRKKSPYPKTHNPVYLLLVREHLTEIINDSSSPLLPLINLKAVKNLIRADGDVFDKPWFGQLMKGPQLIAFLIQADAWLRNYRVVVV
jgi:asparagine synthase (glutamine-hydrolysing)